MTTEERRRLQVIHLDKERAELRERLRATGKRIDHFERALRREEVPLLETDYDNQLAAELVLYEQSQQQKLALAAARHQESIRLKNRLNRILPDYNAYRSLIKDKRSEQFKKLEKEARMGLEAEKSKRRAAFQRYQEEERQLQEEQRRQEELELERKRHEEAERLAREEAVRKETAEKARAREELQRFVLAWLY
jgi:translation initiation factor 3 subunit A